MFFFLNIHFLNNVNNVHSRTVKVDIRGLGPCWVNLREKYSNVQESSGSFLLGGGGGSTVLVSLINAQYEIL